MTAGELVSTITAVIAAVIAIGSFLMGWRKTGPEIKALDSEVAQKANQMAVNMLDEVNKRLEEVNADNKKLHEEVGRLTQIVQQKDKEITDRDVRIVYLENQVNAQHDQIVTLQAKVTALETGTPC
jgi:predicted nuclease with TOPRIM domain